MKITLLLVGKTAFPYINEGIAIYEKRLGHYVNYSKVEIPELRRRRVSLSSRISRTRMM